MNGIFSLILDAMFKTISSYFVIFLFVSYTLSTPIIWATYFAYQDYIAEEFCVNKQKVDCCGKCYISDVTDEVPQKELPKIEVRNTEITSYIINTLHQNAVDQHSPIRYSPFHPGLPSNGFDQEIIEPPEVLPSIPV